MARVPVTSFFLGWNAGTAHGYSDALASLVLCQTPQSIVTHQRRLGDRRRSPSYTYLPLFQPGRSGDSHRPHLAVRQLGPQRRAETPLLPGRPGTAQELLAPARALEAGVSRRGLQPVQANQLSRGRRQPHQPDLWDHPGYATAAPGATGAPLGVVSHSGGALDRPQKTSLSASCSTRGELVDVMRMKLPLF